jgi:hypothetical protein
LLYVFSTISPQIAGRDEPFRSAIREHLKGHTQGLEDLAIEMLARGLSVRDIENAFKDENGRYSPRRQRGSAFSSPRPDHSRRGIVASQGGAGHGGPH